YVIGPEPPEAVVQRLLDVVGSRALLALCDLAAELRRQHDLVAPALEHPPEERLAVGGAVGVSGVEEVDTSIQRRVDDGPGGGLVESATEVVAAQAHHRGAEAADGSPTHLRHA